MAEVPFVPPALRQQDQRSGIAVRGETWRNAAALVAYLHGHGSTLVPFFTCNTQIAASSNQTFQFLAHPRAQATALLWVVLLDGETDTIAPTLFVEVNGGASRSFGTLSTNYLRADVNDPVALVLFEDVLAVPKIQPTALTLKITADANGAVNVRGIGCYEVPRFALVPGTGEGAVARATVSASQPIADWVSSAQGAQSVRGVWESWFQSVFTARRSGLFAWSVGATSSEVFSTTSATYVPLFVLNPTLLSRGLASGQTSSKCVVAVYADATTSNGEVRFTSNLGTATLTVTAGAARTWYKGILDVDAEDMTQTHGLRGAAYDEVAVEGRNTGGNNLSVQAVSIGEAVLVEGKGDITASNNWDLPTIGDADGSTTMTRTMMLRVNATPTVANHIFSHFDTAAGWVFNLTVAGTLRLTIYDGAAALKHTPTFATTNGKFYVATATYDGTTLRLYVNGTEVGSGTASTGYTTPSVNKGAIGKKSSAGGNAAVDITIFGCAFSDTTVLTADEVAAHWVASQSAGGVVPFRGVESLWSRWLGHTFTYDQIGERTLTENGTPTDADDVIPDWG